MTRENIKFKKYLVQFDKIFVQTKLNEGLTTRMISNITNIPEKRLSEMIRFFNLTVKNRGVTHIINHNYFDEIDTGDKAYFLGFLVADGNLSKEVKKSGNFSKRITFCNSIQDKEIIEKLRDTICPSVGIKWVNKSTKIIKRKDQSSFKFTSEHMFDVLVSKYGIIERKTYDTSFKMPELGEFTRHFIRGFMDGDGSYNRNTLSFVFTSEIFMNQVARFFEKEGFTTRARKEKGKTIDYFHQYINVNNKNITKLYDILYKDASTFLERKRIKFEEKLKINLCN